MSTPQKRKGSQTPASCHDSDSPSKRSRTRFGASGASGSQQRAEASSPKYFNTWGWNRLTIPVGFVCVELVREFYVNIHATDKEAETIKTYVRGKFLDFSIDDISSILLMLPINPDIVGFPYPSSITGPSLNSLAHLCTTHVSEIDETRARFMLAIASNLPIDLCRLMFNLILEASLDNSSCTFLPFGLLVTEFLGIHLIVPESHESRLPTGKPISRITLRLSSAHLGVHPPPPHLESHAVDLDPPKDEVPAPAATDLPSTSTAPPPTSSSSSAAIDSRIADAIASLFAHIDVIHKDLVERIGQVHDRVDLIVER
ncbi:hypothetical protein Acr_01g0011400 [Actinidia rufa]|uniref:Putative plant transposon protein domain-containing protein n=1 Tax=Actinidia rufa TaxID=165716 RepID=A0A7J0E4A7_9ERIC|nr:hypothetical protein Acr_01g0011400 [Actinidia rufa]